MGQFQIHFYITEKFPQKQNDFLPIFRVKVVTGISQSNVLPLKCLIERTLFALA